MVCLGWFLKQGPLIEPLLMSRLEQKGGREDVLFKKKKKTIRGSTLKLDGVVGRLGGSDG